MTNSSWQTAVYEENSLPFHQFCRCWTESISRVGCKNFQEPSVSQNQPYVTSKRLCRIVVTKHLEIIRKSRLILTINWVKKISSFTYILLYEYFGFRNTGVELTEWLYEIGSTLDIFSSSGSLEAYNTLGKCKHGCSLSQYRHETWFPSKPTPQIVKSTKYSRTINTRHLIIGSFLSWGVKAISLGVWHHMNACR